MNPLHSRVALRERALFDVLDLAVRFCGAHARAYAKMGLFVLAPAAAVSCALSWAGGWWTGWAVTLLMTAFAGAPFVALASRLVFSDDVSANEAVRVAWRGLPALAAARAVQALALGASLALGGLPWLWTGTVFLFVVEVILLEQPSGLGAALRRARRIAGARFGPAVAAMLLLEAMPIAAAMLADEAGREVLGGLLEFKPPPSMFREGGSWLALLGWWAAVPLTSTARFFVYLDVRTRAEGWDIQTRFAAIAARAAAPGPPRTVPSLRAPHAILLALALVAAPGVAHAAVDLSHARADVDAAMAQNGYSFCRAPREPLTPRARELCAHASEIPDCQGFAAACARADAMSREPSTRRRSGDFARKIASVAAVLAALGRVAVWLVVAAIVAMVIIPIVRAVARERRRGPKTGGKDEAPHVDANAPISGVLAAIDEEALLARANSLARRGHRATALELYLAASLRALEKRGAVHIAKDRTNGEYVRSCADESAKAALEPLVQDVDRVKFGGADASEEVVSRAAQRAVSIVRAVAVGLLTLTLAFAVGCAGAGALLRRGEDPAGDELLYDVLRRQGIRAEPLGTSLDSLALPAPGERAPAVVIDADRAHLDRETSDHLASWVDAGGVLVLAGAPETWPREFGAVASRSVCARDFSAGRLVREPEGTDDPDDTPPPTGISQYTDQVEHAKLAGGQSLEGLAFAERVAWFDEGTTYAAMAPHGRGIVVGIATDELLTNVGLVRASNAAAMVAILSNTDRTDLRIAQEDDGVAPPSTPVAALRRAGLGGGLLHGLVASIVLFLAVGVRMARPKPSPPPRSYAFATHVEALGALYARAGAAPHALAAYARFVEERLRARMPQASRPRLLAKLGHDFGPTDVASFLASRTPLPLDVCRRLWARATASSAVVPLGDELAVLEELSAAYATATAEDAEEQT